MIFRRKTVRQALEGIGYGKMCETDENFRHFVNDYGNLKCRFPSITLDQNISYYELFKKSQNHVFHFFQNGKRLSFNDIDPFESALCVGYKRIRKHYSSAEVFRYGGRRPFEEVLIVHDTFLLLRQFENFHIFRTDGSRVDKLENVPSHEELLAISKKSFVNTHCHIVIRCIPYGLYCF